MANLIEGSTVDGKRILTKDGIFSRVPGRSSGFHAHLTAHHTVEDDETPIIFDEVNFNIGADYNKATGIYTAPFSGIYIVSWGGYARNTEDADHITRLRLGAATRRIQSVYELAQGEESSHGQVGVYTTFTLLLNRGDTLAITGYSDNGVQLRGYEEDDDGADGPIRSYGFGVVNVKNL